MLKDIQHINFPVMTYLNIRDSKIESIEALTLTFIPMLDDLYMSTQTPIKLTIISAASDPFANLTGR